MISACLVTRGDVSMRPILESLPADWEVVIWNNRLEVDLQVYGRYAAIERASGDIIWVQDDDCVLPAESLNALVAAYQPDTIVANMPYLFRHDFYDDHCLVGFGAIFDRYLPERAFSMGEVPDSFLRTCDITFTALTPRVLVDVPYQNLPWATAEDRMYRQDTHVRERLDALAAVTA